MPPSSASVSASFCPVKRSLAAAQQQLAPNDKGMASLDAPRRSSRVRAGPAQAPTPASPAKKPRLMEPSASAPAGLQVAPKSPRKRAAPRPAAADEADRPLLDAATIQLHTTLLAPSLPFSLSEARSHLCSVDPRFRSLFDSVPLTPFEELASGEEKELDLFKRLVTSILGQQVSWLAARAIIWRFCALFNESLPAQPDWSTRSRESLPFPRPLDVLSSNEAELRTAGLSGAKARYVLDIARRFADGRLDVRQLVRLSEEEVMSKLCEIKGVGPWTAQMMLLFSLRRPDILPVGDLGVQRGMLLLHTSDGSGPAISEAKKRKKAQKDEDGAAETEVEPVVAKVEKTLESALPPIPPLAPASGLTHATLKGRLTKKAKGNVYLTPDEMEALAASWRPYRSVASFFMWAIVDQ